MGPTYDFVDFFPCILLRQAGKPDPYIYIASPFGDAPVRD